MTIPRGDGQAHGMAPNQFFNEYKDGECEWCGNRGAIFVDNSRCERCDGDIFHCSICKEDQHIDNLCRHVFRDNNLEWAGSGVGVPDENVKGAFFKLLAFMPAGFAGELRKAIRSGRFHTWCVAPLIGGGGCLSLYGMPDRDGKSMVNKWGDALMVIGEGENAEESADGYRWLASLYEKKTREANRTTIAWIDEWTSKRATW